MAIDPPHTLDTTSETAGVAVREGSLVEGRMSPGSLQEVRRFIDLSREQSPTTVKTESTPASSTIV
jgi:hypothetical protein